jgi:hypothetical protein
MNLHSLSQGVFHFLLGGGHLRLRAPVENGHLFGSQAKRGPGRIHGGIAAPDNGHPLAYFWCLAQSHLSQEVDGLHRLRAVLSLDSHAETLVRSDGDEDGCVALPEQSVYGINPRIGLYLHPDIGYLPDLRPDGVLGQPVFRYAVAHHATGLGQR